MPSPSRWQPGQLLHVGFPGLVAPPDLLALIRQGRIGGVILFARNIGDPTQVRQLVRTLHDAAPPDLPLTVTTDQEGGNVQRFRHPWTEWPTMRQLGQRDGVEHTQAVATALARELLDLGLNLTLAPIADVDSNPANPIIGDRSFARDPERASRHVAAFVQAANAAKLATCAKHFPGHGDTTLDSHLALPKVEHPVERIRRCELLPFRAAIEAQVPCIMTAHIVFSALDPRRPATMSAEVMALLRDELAYDGLVFTDDLEMKAIADNFSIRDAVLGCLQAGVDVPLVCHSADVRDEALAILERAPDALVERSIARVLAFKARFPPSKPEAGALSVPPYPEHLQLAASLRSGHGIGA